MKRIILVIEHNTTLRQLLTQSLRRRGLDTLEASSGNDGWALANEHRPDLIVCDHHRRGINALELLERLRSHDATIAIPVIVLSTNPAPAFREHCLETGASAFVLKPFTTAEFVSTIFATLGN